MIMTLTCKNMELCLPFIIKMLAINNQEKHNQAKNKTHKLEKYGRTTKPSNGRSICR